MLKHVWRTNEVQQHILSNTQVDLFKDLRRHSTHHDMRAHAFIIRSHIYSQPYACIHVLAGFWHTTGHPKITLFENSKIQRTTGHPQNVTC